MKALMKLDRGAELRDVREPPDPGPGEVILTVVAAGVCGTDVNIVRGTHPYDGERILGHEVAGRVASVGERDHVGHAAPAVGTLVTTEPHVGACLRCAVCRSGRAHLCEHKTAIGIGVDGGFAERIVVPSHLLHAIDESVSNSVAALAEPSAVAFTAVERAEIKPGDAVLVVGPGPIGVLAAMAAATVGANPTLLGRASSRGRLRTAAELGVRCRLLDAEGWPDGRFDVVIDTTGSAAVLTHAVASLRRQGRLCALGFAGSESVPFPWDQALMQAVDVRFSLSSAPDSWPIATAFLKAEHERLGSLVGTFPLARWEEAFAALENRTVVKPVLVPA